MSVCFRALFAASTLLIAFALTTGFKPVLAQEISLDAADFLVSINDGHGKKEFFRSNKVPLIPDRACYRWRLRLSGAESMVSFKEVFSLPSAPDYWPEEDNEFYTSTIAKDRTTSVTERFVAVRDGWVSNGWCVADGDPEGAYSMEIYINGQFAKKFEFQVRSIKGLEVN